MERKLNRKINNYRLMSNTAFALFFQCRKFLTFPFDKHLLPKIFGAVTFLLSLIHNLPQFCKKHANFSAILHWF